MYAKDFRKAALASLRRKWGVFIGLALFCSVIPNLFSNVKLPDGTAKTIFQIFNALWSFGWYPICTVAFSYLFILAIRNRPIKFGDVFYYRTFRAYLKMLGLTFWSGLLVFLWSLLLIVPGIIKGYAYAMAPYIMLDQNVSINEAVTLSRKMMYGYKWKYYCLQISFIGWAILASIPFGIGWLWLIPYYKMATAHFYENLANRPTNY